MHRVLLIGLGICVVWVFFVGEMPADEPIVPVDAAQQALANPLSRLKREKADSDVPTVKPRLPVGPAGDLKRLRVEGARSYDKAQIVAGLLRNFEFQQAARPSAELPALLDVTQKLVLEGYLYRGFLDATVAAEYSGEGNCLVLRIEEGPEYRTGELRVVGANLLPAEKLIARLQAPAKAATWNYQRGGKTLRTAPGEDSKSPFWQADKPAPGDPLSLTHFQQGIGYALAEQGFPFARFTAGLERIAGKQVADLVVTISDEGPEAVISSLTFEGLTRHTEQELRDFLKLEQGMKFSGAVCEEAFAALRNSCRFWRYGVTVDCSAGPADRYAVDPRTVDVRINVLEYELAPRLNEPLTEADEVLVKAAQWLEASWRATPSIELVSQHTSATDAEAEGGEKIDYSVVINNQRGIAARWRGPFQAWDVNIGAIASNDQLALFDWRSGARIDYAGALQPTCTLKISGAERDGDDYTSRVQLTPYIRGGGDSKRAPTQFSGFTAVVEPVAMLDFGRGVGVNTSIKDGILTAGDDRGELQVEVATGRILRYRTQSGTSIEFKLGDEEFERLRREIEAQGSPLANLTSGDWPLLSAMQFVLGAAAEQPPVQRQPLGKLLCRRGEQLFDAYDGDPLAKSLEAALQEFLSKGVEFAIPENLKGLDAVNTTTRVLVQHGPTLAEEFLPRESWAWTWARERCFAAVKYCEVAERQAKLTQAEWTPFVDEYWRQLNAKETGPIGLWVLIALPPRPLGDEWQRDFAKRAYQQFDAAALDNDLKLLVTGEGVLPRLTAAVVRACDDLDEAERKQLRDSLGAPLGDLADMLFQRREAHPDESPADSVTAVVEAAWDAGLRTQLKEQLRQLAKLPEPPATHQAAISIE